MTLTRLAISPARRETARRAACIAVRARFERRPGLARCPRRDDPPRRRDDCVAAGPAPLCALMPAPRLSRDVATSRARTIARPAAVDGVCACAMPSRTESTRPAMNSAAPALSSTILRGSGPSHSVEHLANALRRSRAASPPFSASSAALRQAVVGRMHVERLNRAVAALRHLGVAGRRQLVDPVRAVHDPGALRSQQQQRPRHQLGQLGPRHADDLPRRAAPGW